MNQQYRLKGKILVFRRFSCDNLKGKVRVTEFIKRKS